MECGLLGGKLGHSYSPRIHSLLADYSYTLFEKKPEELADFLKNGSFRGLNVTIPYKKAVIPFCRELSPRAEKLGAVNTIVRRSDGTLVGHNTDYFGFTFMVLQSGLQVSGKKALVLGSGGASATAVAALEEMGADVVVISRSGENNYSNLHLHRDARILVNTTPVGMYPNTDESPVDLTVFPALEGVLDVVYNPARTQLLLQAECLGLTAVNGLWMLVAQAKESAEWFSGNAISDARIRQIHGKLRQEMENTVLIGMPGCGKSTIGQQIAGKTGKTFVDADAVISQQAGMSIPEIFAKEGEAGFRIRETQVLRQLGAQSGLVIATGGGCVTRKENYPHLHCNGRIYWVQRSIDLLPTNGRPLSQGGNLVRMYEEREPLYRAFADHIIENNATIDKAAEMICNLEASI